MSAVNDYLEEADPSGLRAAKVFEPLDAPLTRITDTGTLLSTLGEVCNRQIKLTCDSWKMTLQATCTLFAKSQTKQR